jgi:hypothetical protein
MEEMHWEVLSHSNYIHVLAPRDSYLFGALKETLTEKIFRADDGVKIFVK